MRARSSEGRRPAGRRPLQLVAAATLLTLGLWQVGVGLWIPAKAALAQVLLRAAWDRTQAGTGPAKPWPWADFRPLAELAFGQRRYIVVSDAAGESLAFAPSHVAGTAAPGNPGVSVIAAHRDTHFANLDGVEPGDLMRVRMGDGRTTAYRVDSTAVLNQPSLTLPDDGATRMVLVTCWPLRSLRPHPTQRFVVVATRTEP